MKKNLLIIILASAGIIASTVSRSQGILNPGFENWTHNGLYEDPDNWTTFNLFVVLGGPTTATKTTDKKSGNFALLLETKSYFNSVSGTTDTIPGVAINGEGDGAPFSTRPASIGAWYKYQPMGGDTAFIVVSLTRWNTTSGVREEIASGFFFTSSATLSYQQASVPLIYTPSTLAPDSITIGIVASSGDYPKPGSKLWVDDLTAIGVAGIESLPLSQLQFNIYPNPASNEIQVTSDFDHSGEMILFDRSGRKAVSTLIKGTASKIDIRILDAGMYLYRINNKEGHPVKVGKVNIIK
jgi:hypothetical protein